jgi:hypothetical protein
MNIFGKSSLGGIVRGLMTFATGHANVRSRAEVDKAESEKSAWMSDYNVNRHERRARRAIRRRAKQGKKPNRSTAAPVSRELHTDLKARGFRGVNALANAPFKLDKRRANAAARQLTKNAR